MSKYKHLTLKQYNKNALHIIVEGETKAELIRADLKRSGLTEDDARKAGLACFSLKGVTSYKSKLNDKPGDAA